MTDPKNPPRDGDDGDAPELTRRAIVYVAPAIVSAKLFSALSGCGKVNPTDRSCALVNKVS
jgi:hypothetical protein